MEKVHENCCEVKEISTKVCADYAASVAQIFYEKRVSYYQNLRTSKPEEKTLKDFIESANAPHTKLQDQVLNAPKKSERDALKRHLPAWQIQSAPKKRGSQAALEAEQNGIFILDIDAHDGEKLDKDAITKKAIEQKCTIAVLDTASGKGLAIIIAVSAEIAKPWEFCKKIEFNSKSLEASQAIVFESMTKILGAQVDLAANNPERLRFQCSGVRWGRAWNVVVEPYSIPNVIDKIMSRLGIENDNEQQEEEEAPVDEHNEFFYAHPISEFARAFQGDAGPGSMGTAAAIVTTAALINAKSNFFGDVFPARARAVVLAYTGAGKTAILDLIRPALAGHGVVITNPKTTAALRECIRRAGTEKKTEDGEDVQQIKQYADHVFSTIDEGGDHLNARSKDPNGLDLLGFFRELNGGYVTLDELKDTKSVTVPTNFTGIVWSTPEQYARFSGQIDGANGERRRVLEFIEPKPEKAKSMREAVEERKKRRAVDIAVYDFIKTIAEKFNEPDVILNIPEEEEYYKTSEPIYAELSQAGYEPPEIVTLINNYSTFIAAVRIAKRDEQKLEILPEDIRATACILRATAIKSRAKLAELEEREHDRLYQPQGAIWSAIRDRIQSGKNRKDKMLLWLANRQPEYREVFDAMIARGELIAERDGKRYFLRFTTPEEREKARAEQRPQRQTIPSTAKQHSTADTFKRCEAYLETLKKGGLIDHTQNDNTLRMIAGKVKANADLMKDERGCFEWFSDLCKRPEFNTAKPYTDKDVERLWADRNLSKVAR